MKISQEILDLASKTLNAAADFDHELAVQTMTAGLLTRGDAEEVVRVVRYLVEHNEAHKDQVEDYVRCARIALALDQIAAITQTVVDPTTEAGINTIVEAAKSAGYDVQVHQINLEPRRTVH